MKLRNSLLTKYLLIILVAIMILPLSFPVISIFVFMPLNMGGMKENIYQNGVDIEKLWHKEAKKLAHSSKKEINQQLSELHKTYKEANMFWVDESGNTQKTIPETLSIPKNWSPSYTIEFMKKSHGVTADPFTVVAFIGENKDKGFMVVQVPRSIMISNGEMIRDKYEHLFLVGIIFIVGLFIIVSWIFFYKIRKRLLRIQKAMTRPTSNGIPEPLDIKKMDEIGQLEEAFNEMIKELESSRIREKEEEELRRQLIANLSHDLRTPLTTIRGHAYSLRKESLTDKGKQSIELIDYKVGYLSQLIENLLSYTLLSSGKYPFYPEKTDISRLLRTSIANWYPTFENKGFQIELDIPEEPFYWEVDKQWFERIVDNLLQNINRHANSGKFVAIRVEIISENPVIIIEDRGEGMNGESTGKGAGIGLSIVDLMIKEMKLAWKIDSTERGTRIMIGSVPFS
ncbi:HAMP domain-containing sensor histidine kinase [Bacillus sp. 31A1R]|uniref:histidine kinase n=1 Tax=Robertmurraya mangrovi TaxID=3098077 RepID=A0ABU5IX39_9BACI|nr:HAMP domain-containing sensor histidine kinase [Bacillus sp. 31A1R]MDZ5471739.1 HAMP domain-containing sensor histidine kinase [Bacillus sp. 31A1R]